MNNPDMQDQNWDRFLPSFKKKNVKSRKPFKVNVKKKDSEYTPFPPAQTPRKVRQNVAAKYQHRLHGSLFFSG